MIHDDAANHPSIARILLIGVALVAIACSGGGPTGPAQGSPEWYWEAAVESQGTADHDKTIEHLDAIIKSGGDLASKATLWRATLLVGLTRGYDELADVYEEGETESEGKAGFQNTIADYRRQSRKNAIAMYECAGDVKKLIGSAESVTLDFPLPEGSESESPILATVKSGRTPGTQAAVGESHTLTRGVLLAAAALTGNGSDVAKTRSQLSAGGASPARTEFEFSFARSLLDAATMFDRDGLNEPKLLEPILALAETWAEPYLEDEAFKDRAEDFKFDATNEHRTLEGKRKMAKPEE